MPFFLMTFLFFTCNNNEPEIEINTTPDIMQYETLPIHPESRPKTTPNIPHVQINVETIPEVHEEMMLSVHVLTSQKLTLSARPFL